MLASDLEKFQTGRQHIYRVWRFPIAQTELEIYLFWLISTLEGVKGV